MRNHARVRVIVTVMQMMRRKTVQISISSFICFGIFHAMDEGRPREPVKKLTQYARAHAFFVHELRERISLETNVSQREWLEKIVTLHQQLYGKSDVQVPNPVIPSRPKSSIRISGELAGRDIKKMVLEPSANSAFVSYQEFAKNSSDTSKS